PLQVLTRPLIADVEIDGGTRGATEHHGDATDDHERYALSAQPLDELARHHAFPSRREARPPSARAARSGSDAGFLRSASRRRPSRSVGGSADPRAPGARPPRSALDSSRS